MAVLLGRNSYETHVADMQIPELSRGMAAVTHSQSKRESEVKNSAKESTGEPASVGRLEETSGEQTDPRMIWNY